MKKLLLLTALSTIINASTALAVPVPGVPDVGIQGGVGIKESYIEGRVAPKLTIGYKYVDRDEYGHQNDFYAKYNLVGSHIQLLGGWRNHMSGQSDSIYGGVGVSTPHVLGLQPYATYVVGSHFDEAQIGLNYNLALGLGFNVNYHNYMPDNGDNEHGVGAGVTYRF
ncbi:hypothetical protein AB840_04430 [Megasphaera cerevisiae DSM 20462]|uniref:Histidine kinase n=1 Tax=Megasphaera cerevisiae DSM 20462 TaxID=1122219 RepID=A0A0J6WZ35_9FIRM|nr:hypothetical protein [Megasphaera cerevisiae]KMO87132.1 hypothetical protein AB840_04430 [Megasphaera cerevisiae DSM 20462]SJZ46178.1 outer membrane insertion C-terminal signal [Megasphaera cerevisiae DSM 20462]